MAPSDDGLVPAIQGIGSNPPAIAALAFLPRLLPRVADPGKHKRHPDHPGEPTHRTVALADSLPENWDGSLHIPPSAIGIYFNDILLSC
jgi:hypothetical protein